MKKLIAMLLMTGIMAAASFNAPALAAGNYSDTSNISENTQPADDTLNSSTDQNNVKYFNLQYGDNKNLLLMNYQVQEGDTLAGIADRFNMSTEVLKFLNQIQDEVQPGQQIIVAIPQINSLNVSLKAFNETKPNPGVQASAKVDPEMPADPNPRKIDPTIRYSQRDLDLLARIVYSEARGESFKGQVAVAAVALNRLKSPLFPKTLSGVIFQPWAFTAVNDGQFYLTPDDKAYLAAKVAMRGSDPSKGALYYWNPVTATSKWIWSRTILGTIGNHVFGI